MRDEELMATFTYDPETGVIMRIASPHEWRVGVIAGFRKRDGYIGIRVGKKEWAAHRLAWFLHFGEWPSGTIDHINRRRDDNRIANLRLATPSQNSANQPGRGVFLKGVTLHKTGKFQAQIKANGKSIYLGLHDSEQQAHAAYCSAAKQYFGEFASAA